MMKLNTIQNKTLSSRQAFKPVCGSSQSRKAIVVASAALPVSRVAQRVCSTSRAPRRLSAPLRAAASNGAVVGKKLISSTEVPAFIPRDDMMDQLFRWSLIEAAEGGQRNFGMPMKVEPFYRGEDDNKMLWGFDISIFREGVRLTDIQFTFDDGEVNKYEFVGRAEDGFPMMEGGTTTIMGKNIQIWKMDETPVDEDLRSTIRSLCTGTVAALNNYYAFGSVFVEDSQ